MNENEQQIPSEEQIAARLVNLVEGIVQERLGKYEEELAELKREVRELKDKMPSTATSAALKLQQDTMRAQARGSGL
ncbi:MULTISPECIES: hypothetical protein [Trichocoleus]|uniref:Uncharacterized protein n=1 Tax=Trichocoleus desertorum GB2-A4 TaxID=2933944 RepID=A0ABV0JB94_9CYAN|nr:hypothetical protein [Trichocoleus sp. FACHB-46]MBD1860839.1 hypothetical protein [Trichocoleus sp. FACHB-46]